MVDIILRVGTRDSVVKVVTNDQLETIQKQKIQSKMDVV